MGGLRRLASLGGLRTRERLTTLPKYGSAGRPSQRRYAMGHAVVIVAKRERRVDARSGMRVQGGSAIGLRLRAGRGVSDVRLCIGADRVRLDHARLVAGLCRRHRTALALGIAIVLGIVFFALPIIVRHVAITRSRPRRETVREFLAAPVETATGPLPGASAWLQVLIIPLALALAATLIGATYVWCADPARPGDLTTFGDGQGVA